MSGSPSFPLQTAVYARLSGDATLVTTLGADVYDAVPDDADFPYVSIGECTESPNDTMGKTGRDMTITVHTWSRYEGMKEVDQIQDRVDALLDRWAPTVSGWSATTMLHEFFESLTETLESSHRLRHGVARYRIHISET